ncbi:MAG: HAD family hydrolase [Cyanobacteria bacterium J06641_5]
MLHSLTVFCDFDGPLVDVSERYYCTYRQALAATQAEYARDAIGLTPLTKEQFWQRKRERTCDLEIALRSGLRVKHVTYFVDRVQQSVNHPDLLSKDRFHPGVDLALALLHSQGARLAIVTLRHQEQVRAMLQSHGLTRLLTGIYGSSTHDAAYRNNTEHKQALLAQALAQHPSENACVIGDTEADLLAAKAAGIPAIALLCGIRSHSYLQQYAPNSIQSDLLVAARYLSKYKGAVPEPGRFPLMLG